MALELKIQELAMNFSNGQNDQFVYFAFSMNTKEYRNNQSEWIMESKNNMKMLGVKFFVLLQLQHLQSITQKRSSASKWHLTSDTLCCFDLISMQYNAVFCIRPIISPIHGNVKLTFSGTH